MNKQDLPEIGKTYVFLDNGDRSREYEATIIYILKYKDAPDYLKQAYFDNLKECDWLYQEYTDYFIGAEIPEYDKHTIWFVRSKKGGWFSMDIQSDWQSGELIINKEIMDSNCIDYTINGKNYSRFDIIKKAKEKLIQSTNITKEELKVIDALLFRIWQMGWLPESLLKEE